MQATHPFESIMLIDDNEIDNLISKVILSDCSFSKEIYIYNNAKEALNDLISIATSQKPGLFPEVIFVDLNMPVMDGFDFLYYAYELTKKYSLETRFVILTSSIYHSDKRRAREINPEILFLNKPLTEELLQIVLAAVPNSLK